MARVLITGASGLLGANLVVAAAKAHDVIAIHHRHPLAMEGVQVVSADLSQADVAQRVVLESGADWVVHCAAAADVDACEADPSWARRLNRSMPQWIAAAAYQSGARLVHVSTDAVFDGRLGGYHEGDTPNPINVYGKTKYEGEVTVAAAHPGALIVRTNLYGWNAQDKRCLAEWFLHHLERGRVCGGFVDVWVTPILANDLATLVLRMLDSNLAGLYHLAGKDCLSKFAFGVQLAQTFGLDASLIRPVSVQDSGLLARRPSRLCLRSDKAESDLGLSMPSIQEGLARFREMLERSDRQRLKGLMRRSS